MATNEQVYRFDDGEAYDRYMGAWSREACPVFLAWVGAPPGAAWLDVGCGTGVLTETIIASQSPASIEAIDPSEAQVETARARFASATTRFQVADACALPFADGSFDIVASALVVNFIPDRPKALAEMRRVLRKDGGVAGFVWDFAAERAPGGPVRRALMAAGETVATVPGSADSPIGRFARLFSDAGFADVETWAFDVERRFESFDSYWTLQTGRFSPSSAIVRKMAPEAVARTKEFLRAELAIEAEGTVVCTARANAVKAKKP